LITSDLSLGTNAIETIPIMGSQMIQLSK